MSNQITQALADLRVDASLGSWIDLMLRGRVILVNFSELFVLKFGSRGTSQGGVLFPLLWNLIYKKK